jgi:hypothetical protein
VLDSSAPHPLVARPGRDAKALGVVVSGAFFTLRGWADGDGRPTPMPAGFATVCPGTENTKDVFKASLAKVTLGERLLAN